MSDGPVILTLDIGSSSVRSRLYGPDLTPRESPVEADSRYEWQLDGGAMECDAVALFDLVAGVVDAAVEEAVGAGLEIRAVAPTSFWHSLMGLDGQGRPLTPLYGWGDSRSGPAAQTLRRTVDEVRYHRETGCFLRPVYPAVRLRWLRESHPAYDSVETWTSFADYLEGRIFGTRRASISLASATGLLDLRELRWHEEILGILELDEARLPDLVDLDPVRGMAPKWAERWPSLEDVPWFPTVGDGAAANLGSGAIGTDSPGLTVGTSAAIRVLWRVELEEDPPPDLWCYQLDSSYRVSGGALSNGGNALAFLLRTLPSLELDALDAALGAVPPDRHGLTVIPSLVPERGDPWADETDAGVVGLTLQTTPREIAMAWLESIAQRVAWLMERLETTFGPANGIVASGGALNKLPGWLHTFADASGRPIRLSDDPEASSRGAAILVARELGWIEAIEDARSPAGPAVQPVGEHFAAHRRARERQLRITRALEGR